MALITIKIERTARSTAGPHARRYGRRVVAVLAAAGLLAGGLSAASAARAAGVVSIPPKLLLNKVSLAANKTVAVTVLGGSTTVPTDATRVVLSATVSHATANGTLTANPQGHKAGASGDVLPYTIGHTATGAFTEPVGTNNKITFSNQGGKAITLSVSLTGYSTEVRASDIAATGGSAGQVLTNTGTGAAWQPPGHAYGVADPFAGETVHSAFATVASLDVPAGSYVVTFSTSITVEADTDPTDQVECILLSPANLAIGAALGSTNGASNPQSVVTAQGLVANSSGGTITVQCADIKNGMFVEDPTLIANSVGAVSGFSGNTPVRHGAVLPVPRLPTTHP